MIWKTHILLILTYVLVIGSVELVYLSSVLYKFDQGGYLPLALAAILMFVMYVWNNVYQRKYYYEVDNKISPEKLREIACDTSLCRLPGLAMFYSELVQGIPPIFKHYIENVPALHSVLVFVSIKSLPISRVPMEERFLFRRVEPNELYVFRCVVRYGYIDVRNENEPFEKLLVEKLKEFIVKQYYYSQKVIQDGKSDESQEVLDKQKVQEEIEKETEAIEKASRAGIVHMIDGQEVL
jgi:KUP system potassium uptake protein